MSKLPALVLLCFSLSCMAAEGHFAIDHRIPLEGAEGWDYLAVDTASDRLFITRGNHVDVVDLRTEKVIGKISEPIDGAHGVAFAPALKKGYITSGKSEKVVAFDLGTLKVSKEIPAGKKADAIAYDESTSRIFAFNGLDQSITVIDANNDVVLKTIKLDGKPEFAVSDNQGHVYFNNEDKSSLFVIDAKEMNITNSWPLKGCSSPSGLSADFSSRRLFSVCENKVMAVSDIDQAKVIKTLPIGEGSDASAFDSGLVFSSNGEGTLTVVQESNPKSFHVLENIKTQKGARTMAVDPKTHRVYLITAQFEAADPKVPHAKGKIIPGTVELLVVKK